MNIDEILLAAGVQPTPNRLLVLRELQRAGRILSLRELEDRIDTVDKSGIFRVLRLFADHHLVHEIDDGTGSAKYEPCHVHRHDTAHDDQHVHFFCRRCHRTFCLDHIAIPLVELPPGYLPEETNYVIKGLCPACEEE